MKKVTMYKAESGKLFDSKAECQEYESKLDDARAANKMFCKGATLRKALIRANRTRPWWDINLNEEQKELLAKITKNTRIAVPQWPKLEGRFLYKVTKIDSEGFVYLWSESDGEQRPYGNWVVIGDLLRYARQTFTMNMLCGDQARK